MKEYFLYFLMWLLGSAHCIGMCGPIVLAYSIPLKAASGRKQPDSFFIANQLMAHVTYNSGRVLMWVFLGMTLATIGGIINSLAQIENIMAIVGGTLILLLGIEKLGLLPRFRFGDNNGHRIFRFYQRAFQLLITETSLNGKLALGLLNGLLPCGFSYALLVKAAVAGSALKGGLVMFSFGSGTVPALLLTGLLATKISDKFRRWGEGIAVAIVLLLGIVLILRGFGYHFPILHPMV
ncbi:MAG: sulfite exporter TauE/SafE family protein [bacterium]